MSEIEPYVAFCCMTPTCIRVPYQGGECWLCPDCARRLRSAATYARTVLTRLADSAYQWAGRDVPVGLISEIDEAKARLAGVLGE